MFQENETCQIFRKSENFLPFDTHRNVCISGGKKCLFFGKLGVLCFLKTLVLRFALSPYYRRKLKMTNFQTSIPLCLRLFIWRAVLGGPTLLKSHCLYEVLINLKYVHMIREPTHRPRNLLEAEILPRWNEITLNERAIPSYGDGISR